MIVQNFLLKVLFPSKPHTYENIAYQYCYSDKWDSNITKEQLVNISRVWNKEPTITIYDENEDIKNLDSITKDSKMITILEILGVKWTTQSAQLDICLRQVMLLDDKPIFTKCLIKTNTTVNNEKLQTKKNKTIIAEKTDTDTNNKNEEEQTEKENKIENIPVSGSEKIFIKNNE